MSAALPWSHTLEGLPLLEPTSRQWFPVVMTDLTSLLIDHAHCEQKAASTALSLMGRYAGDPGIVRSMLAIAHEELRHFKQVVDLLEKRGTGLTSPRPDRYVRELREWSFRHKGGAGPKADAFLAAAFVEARSCERFRLLAEGLHGAEDLESLQKFYAQLADAESRHWETFRDLALNASPKDQVERRLGEMASAEADIIRHQPIEPRMH